MTWLNKIRAKSNKEKIRLIWMITGVAFIILIAVWVIIGNYNYNVSKDLTIFQTIGQGINDFKTTVK